MKLSRQCELPYVADVKLHDHLVVRMAVGPVDHLLFIGYMNMDDKYVMVIDPSLIPFSCECHHNHHHNGCSTATAAVVVVKSSSSRRSSSMRTESNVLPPPPYLLTSWSFEIPELTSKYPFVSGEFNNQQVILFYFNYRVWVRSHNQVHYSSLYSHQYSLP
jgi:hypothetical protein